MQIISDSGKLTINLGERIARLFNRGDIICLFGQLGSGKTVLVKGIAKGLGISSKKITSPSFVLMREYAHKIPFYHFDLYRLKKPRQILEAGFQEYLYAQGISVIEWADRLKYLLPQEFLKIELIIKAKTKRLIKFNAKGKHYRELLKKINEAICVK